MGPIITGYLPMLQEAKYLTRVNHILSYVNGYQHSLTARMGPYFLIVNPFQPKGFIQKWANNPQYCDPSLKFFVVVA